MAMMVSSPSPAAVVNAEENCVAESTQTSRKMGVTARRNWWETICWWGDDKSVGGEESKGRKKWWVLRRFIPLSSL
jgi:hypothetical protein